MGPVHYPWKCWQAQLEDNTHRNLWIFSAAPKTDQVVVITVAQSKQTLQEV